MKLTLYKFYDLINRNANVTLANATLDKTFYDGLMKSIPNTYDDWKVIDFSVSNDGDFLFQIEQ